MSKSSADTGDFRMLRHIQTSKRVLGIPLGVWFLLFMSSGIVTGLAVWLLARADTNANINVWIRVAPYSLVRYDDHAGNFGLGAIVQITNISKSTVWVMGHPGAPTCLTQQLVDREWKSSVHAQSFNANDPWSKQWTALRSMDSITILASPISEEAAAVRVGVPVTTERFAPAKAQWVFTPTVKIVKRGGYYFPELFSENGKEKARRPVPKVNFREGLMSN